MLTKAQLLNHLPNHKLILLPSIYQPAEGFGPIFLTSFHIPEPDFRAKLSQGKKLLKYLSKPRSPQRIRSSCPPSQLVCGGPNLPQIQGSKWISSLWKILISDGCVSTAVVLSTNNSGCSTHIITNKGSHVSYISSPRVHIQDTSPLFKKVHLLIRIEQEIDLEFEFKPPLKIGLDVYLKSSRIKRLLYGNNFLLVHMLKI